MAIIARVIQFFLCLAIVITFRSVYQNLFQTTMAAFLIHILELRVDKMNEALNKLEAAE